MCIMGIVRILKQTNSHIEIIYRKGKVKIMNKETKLMNLQKTSKVFAIFSKIFEVFCYVAAGLCGAAIIATVTGIHYFGIKLVEAGPEDKIFTMLSENMDANTAFIIFLVLLIIFLLANAFLMRKIGTLFRNINENYSPFIPENVKLIKLIAIIFGVITLIEVGLIPGLMSAFVIWGVALLFDYGYELQNESDEII